MGRTISVKKVVEVFDNYLNNTEDFVSENSSSMFADRKFFYTNDYKGNIPQKCGDDEIIKLSRSEFIELKKQNLEDVYNKINSNYSQHGYKLLIRELLFKKVYECYMDYKNGKIGLNDELDVIEDIVGCDKQSDSYYINTVNELFKNCINATYDINYGDGAIDLFPDRIDDEYFKEYGYCEKEEYDLMIRAADGYLEYEYYKLGGFHSAVEDETNYYGIVEVDIPEEITKQFLDRDSGHYIYENLKGTEIYDFGIGSNEEEEENNWYIIAEELVCDFWDIRHECMKVLSYITKLENGETEGIDKEFIQWYENMELLGNGFREQYDKLSLEDFEMTDDRKLKIVNNQEIYRLFGIDEKYLECETELETELGR